MWRHSRVSQCCRIDVGSWERLETAPRRAASQQHGEFLGINAVCFRFSAVNGFQVERVTEQKWQIVKGTQVSEPVPVEGWIRNRKWIGSDPVPDLFAGRP